jgi:rhodanese-related sulfurtransferase
MFKIKSIFKIIVLLNLLIFSSCSNTSSENFKTIDFSEFEELLDENKENKDFVIIDIRTKREILVGKIENALEIDFYLSNFRAELNKLDKNKTYLIYCRSGNRSGQALKIMKELGFKIVYNLEGGINTLTKNNFNLSYAKL